MPSNDDTLRFRPHSPYGIGDVDSAAASPSWRLRKFKMRADSQHCFDACCQRRDRQEGAADHMAQFMDHTANDVGTEIRSNFRLRNIQYAKPVIPDNRRDDSTLRYDYR